jgi:hypothetical protein
LEVKLTSVQRLHPEETEQVAALTLSRFFSSDAMWHFLYFLPLPHQQGSFLPMLGGGSLETDAKSFLKKPEMFPPGICRLQLSVV